MEDLKQEVFEILKRDCEVNGFAIAKGICRELKIPYTTVLTIIRTLADEGKVERAYIRKENTVLHCFKITQT